MQIVFHAYGLEHSISFQLYTRLLLRNSQFLRNQLLMLQHLADGGGRVCEGQSKRCLAGRHPLRSADFPSGSLRYVQLTALAAGENMAKARRCDLVHK